MAARSEVGVGERKHQQTEQTAFKRFGSAENEKKRMVAQGGSRIEAIV